MTEHIKATMQYIGKWWAGVLMIGLGIGIMPPVLAQTPELASVCYMQLPNRVIVNLTKLCGDPRRQTGQKSAIAERQAQFLKDFYQQIQDYPEGMAIMAGIDPDALIGKANLVCQALKAGRYAPPPSPPAIDQPEFRRLADLEETVVAQVAQQSFCPETAN
jgi:hypothetical protein